MDWVKSSFELLERIPSVSWRWSIVFLVLGGTLHIAMWVEFIPNNALHGYIEEASPVIITLGIGFFLIGAVTSIVVGIKSHSKRSAERKLILDNIRFVPSDALPILYIALNEPQGRIPSPGDIDCCRRLQELGILSPKDNPWGGLHRGNMLTLSRTVFRKRKRLSRQIAKRIEREFQIQPSESTELTKLVGRIISEQSRQRAFL